MRRILGNTLLEASQAITHFLISNKAILDLGFYLQVMQPVRWRLLVESLESLPVSLMIASVLSAVPILQKTPRLFCDGVN